MILRSVNQGGIKTKKQEQKKKKKHRGEGG
jgi:hypothetical protein